MVQQDRYTGSIILVPEHVERELDASLSKFTHNGYRRAIEAKDRGMQYAIIDF
jgi:hypothetical protein